MILAEKSCAQFFVFWLSTLLLFFILTSDEGNVSNCNFIYRSRISTSVGTLLILWQSFQKASTWSYVLFLVHCALKQKLYFPTARCNIPETVYNGRNKMRRRPYYGNLAFGGRGPPYLVRDSRIFDSTLGYPGEESENVGTNTRDGVWDRHGG